MPSRYLVLDPTGLVVNAIVAADAATAQAVIPPGHTVVIDDRYGPGWRRDPETGAWTPPA
jgi:hypothetical protein